MNQDQPRAVRNRLLASLSEHDWALLEPMLERVPLDFQSVLVKGNQPIEHVIFLESGIVSTVADTEEGRIEIGLIGREGFVGVPVALGTDRSPHTYLVQSPGEGLRIAARDLRSAIAERPSISKPLGLYVQALIVQIAHTAYANVTFDIEARLARWLLMTQDRLSGNELSMTHDFLSAMLGVRRPGVTIATHVLEGSGAIRATRGRIEVRNRGKLEELAGDSYGGTEREYERLMAEI